MAFRKIIEVEGKSVVETSIGIIDNGIQKLSFPAYIKVTSITGDKAKVVANVNFKGGSQQFNKQYEVDMSVEAGSTNFIAQVYEHLKTLPEFAGATDC
jgi:hypothetical protein